MRKELVCEETGPCENSLARVSKDTAVCMCSTLGVQMTIVRRNRCVCSGLGEGSGGCSEVQARGTRAWASGSLIKSLG